MSLTGSSFESENSKESELIECDIECPSKSQWLLSECFDLSKVSGGSSRYATSHDDISDGLGPASMPAMLCLNGLYENAVQYAVCGRNGTQAEKFHKKIKLQTYKSIALVKILCSFPFILFQRSQVLSTPKVIARIQNYIRRSLTQKLKRSAMQFSNDNRQRMWKWNLYLCR